MRVIAGIAKGRKLKAPKGRETRPTADRVKEALFNILANRVIDATFLDLFAGTGSIGIEALSRGAKEVVFVEQSPSVCRIISENLTLTGFSDHAVVYKHDVGRVLKTLGDKKYGFDLIFVDPPYLKDFEGGTLAGIVDYGLLNPGGVVVIEKSTKDQIPDSVQPLRLYREEKYGDTTLNFYQLTDELPDKP